MQGTSRRASLIAQGCAALLPICEVAQLVERRPVKALVAGSRPALAVSWIRGGGIKKALTDFSGKALSRGINQFIIVVV